MAMVTAVSVAPRQRMAVEMRPSISTTSSSARAMALLDRFCAQADISSMAIIKPTNAPHSLRETRILSICMAVFS